MSAEHLVPFKSGDDDRRNVNGANKGSRWSKKIIEEQFAIVTKAKNLSGEEIDIPIGTQVIISCIKNAIDGDTKSLKELLDRLEGTPTQTINQKVEGSISKSITEWVDTPSQENGDKTE